MPIDKKIMDIIKNMDKIHPNEDCSECAERVKKLLGNRGKIVTIAAFNKNNDRLCEFKTSAKSSDWKYHTVVLIQEHGIKYIIDITDENKITPLEVYMDNLINANYNGISKGMVFIMIDGDVGGKLLNSIYISKINLRVLGTYPTKQNVLT